MDREVPAFGGDGGGGDGGVAVVSEATDGDRKVDRSSLLIIEAIAEWSRDSETKFRNAADLSEREKRRPRRNAFRVVNAG